MSGKRESKKSQTRKVILDAAAGLFTDNGYGQTTIEQISRAAGVGKATLYGYFPSKEDIHMVLSIDAFAAAILASHKRVDKKPTFAEQYESIYLSLFDEIKRNEELMLFIINNPYKRLLYNNRSTDLITFLSGMVTESHFNNIDIDNNVSVMIFAHFASAMGLWYGGHFASESNVMDYIKIYLKIIFLKNMPISQ